METVFNIIGCLGFVLGLINLFKKKDYPSKAEFTEMNEEVKNNSNILRNSKA